MSTHKHFDKICYVVSAIMLIFSILFMRIGYLNAKKTSTIMEYESTLFDTSRVHTINIIMDNWDEFIANCRSEEYYNCSVEIDNDICRNVAIRGKGNTSLTQVESYGNDRYSFKIQFDYYDSANTYKGLDKLCLNNIIQDNTYMKDYLAYQMMNAMEVASPLCSYAYITVNGEDWGLYLAVEGVEKSFLQRNYGNDYGELYKPDSMSMGDRSANSNDGAPKDKPEDMEYGMPPGEMPEGMKREEMPQDFPDGKPDKKSGDFMRDDMARGSDDVLLKYIDDDVDSYSNIFDNAKTDITKSDKTRLIKALKQLSEGEDMENTVDVEAVIRYFVVHNFVLNFDSYTGSMIHNYYLYEKDGQMQMIPWDYNLAFGGFEPVEDATSFVNYPIDSPVSGGNTEDRPMIAWIFENEEYTELYHEYFSEFILEYFDSGYFAEMMDTVSSMISPYVEKDPTKFCTYEEFEAGTTTLNEFCLLRAESISGQLDGSIGATSDTQESDTLIDASAVQMTAMGSMHNTMDGNRKHK